MLPKGMNYVLRYHWLSRSLTKCLAIADKNHISWEQIKIRHIFGKKWLFTGGALVFWKRKGFNNHPSSQDRKNLPGVTDQLEMGDSNSTLFIHVLLVFVLYQTLHQVPRVYLVICHILGKTKHIYPSSVTTNEKILHPSPWKMQPRLILELSQTRYKILNYVKIRLRNYKG